MATELENSIRNAASKVSEYIADAAEMKVTTQYVDVGDTADINFDQAKPAASTVIKLDGDSEIVVPRYKTPNGNFELDASLLDLHHENVATAIEYRARILDSILSVFKRN